MRGRVLLDVTDLVNRLRYLGSIKWDLQRITESYWGAWINMNSESLARLAAWRVSLWVRGRTLVAGSDLASDRRSGHRLLCPNRNIHYPLLRISGFSDLNRFI